MKAFLAVAAELHFGRAAAQLHTASPVLSRTIQQLERQLGSRLFERTTRTVRLTAAGQALLGPAQDIIADFAMAERAVRFAGEGVIGTVSIGFAGPSTHDLVSRLVKAVRSEQPGIQLTLNSTMYGAGALDQLSSHVVDLAMVRWDVAPIGMQSRVVSLNYYRIAVSSTHRLAEKAEVAFADLSDEEWVLLPPSGSQVRAETMRKAADAGFNPLVAQEAPDTTTILALVAAGVGITMTFDTAVPTGSMHGVRILRIVGDNTAAPSRLVWRRQDDNPALKRVREISAIVLPSLPPSPLGEAPHDT